MEPVIPKIYDAEVEIIHNYVSRLQLVLNLGEKLEFEPGQYVTLVLKIDGVITKRCYSIWCRYGNSIILMIEVVEGGKMTEYIRDHIDEGDRIKVIGPMGLMTIQNKRPHKFFISTGTGIVPFSCMIDKLIDDPDSYITLVSSFKDEDEGKFLQIERLRHMSNTSKHFNTYFSLTRPSNEEDYFFIYRRGRVNKIFPIALTLMDVDPPYKDIEFYICGLSNMIKDVKKQLFGYNIIEEQIITEQYD